MTAMRQIRWKWVLLAGLLAEITVLALFFLLLLGATLAGVPEIAAPMSTLDNIDAMVSSFATMFLFTLWAAKRIDSALVLHGALIGVFGIILFSILWVSTAGPLGAQPWPYLVAHALKVVGGIAGGLVAERRRRRAVVA
jgi:hypothetical protein